MNLPSSVISLVAHKTFFVKRHSISMGGCCSSEPKTLHEQIARSVKNCDAAKYYNINDEIGSGAMGAVYVCSPKPHRVTIASSVHGKNSKGKPVTTYALKVMNSDKLSDKFGVSRAEILNEIDTLKELDHPFIVRLIETFEDKQHIYLVMERCFGNDLFSRAPYSEKSAARITSQILSAVAFMHSRNIIHRDLKFDNIMFETMDEDSPVKIIDFGLAKKYSSRNQYVTGFGGTVTYMAPEILREIPYTSKADIWSVGVICYMLLASEMPFQCEDRSQSLSTRRKVTIDKILERNLKFDKPCWKEISTEAKNMIESLCENNVSKRLTALEALQTKWLRNMNNLSDKNSVESDWLEKLSYGFKRFSKANGMKRLGSLIVAHRMPNTPEIIKLRQLFQALDNDNNGTITLEEFKKPLLSIYSENEVNKMFADIDIGNDGVISYTEFLAATIEVMIQVEDERLKEAFDVIAQSETDNISKSALKSFLGSRYDEDEFTEFGDEITYQEFKALFRSKNRRQANSLIGPAIVA